MTIKNIDREKLLAAVQPGFCKFNGFDIGAVIHELLAEPETDYQALYEAQCDELATLRALSVTRIMLDVVPGSDGMGHEVYATCVDDVVNALSKQGERIEELESEIQHWREAGSV